MARWISRIASPFPQTPDAWYQEILQQWDKAWDRAEFPYLGTDSHWAFAKARLSAFRSDDEWLTIFELLTYFNGLGDFEIGVYAFGNKVQRPGIQPYIAPSTPWFRIFNWEVPPARHSAKCSEKEGRYHGLKVPSSETEDWCPDPFDFEVMLHGVQHRFTFTRDDYIQAGIDLDAPLSGEICLDRIIQVLRLLSYRLPPEQLFFSESMLLEYVNRPTTLPLFLQLDEWCHPGVEHIAKPSDSPCFRSLAKALTYNQPDLYECPETLVNTHWSRWPQFVSTFPVCARRRQ